MNRVPSAVALLAVDLEGLDHAQAAQAAGGALGDRAAEGLGQGLARGGVERTRTSGRRPSRPNAEPTDSKATAAGARACAVHPHASA